MCTPEEIIEKLKLDPHPGEGGYYRETYRSRISLPAAALPGEYTDCRAACTAIYYLLTPQMCSAMHRLPGDEIFHFYLGDAVEMLQLHPDGHADRITLGNDLEAGMQPQVVVSGGTWQGSRLRAGGKMALLGTTMAPGFEFKDYVSGRRNELVSQYPAYAELITVLTPGQETSISIT